MKLNEIMSASRIIEQQKPPVSTFKDIEPPKFEDKNIPEPKVGGAVKLTGTDAEQVLNNCLNRGITCVGHIIESGQLKLALLSFVQEDPKDTKNKTKDTKNIITNTDIAVKYWVLNTRENPKSQNSANVELFKKIWDGHVSPKAEENELGFTVIGQRMWNANNTTRDDGRGSIGRGWYFKNNAQNG